MLLHGWATAARQADGRRSAPANGLRTASGSLRIRYPWVSAAGHISLKYQEEGSHLLQQPQPAPVRRDAGVVKVVVLLANPLPPDERLGRWNSNLTRR